MDETNEKIDKKAAKQNHFLSAVQSLLESITDKDENFRNTIESSLVRMIECQPNETLTALGEFRQKNPKLAEQQVSLTLRVIEKFTISNSNKINEDNISKVIDLCILDMIKSQDHIVAVQNPAVEILVAIGRLHCDKVMASLSKHLQQGHIGHFMILNCMGSVATANTVGIFPFIKPVLETILPTLSMIKIDHVKQAYAFGIGRFAEAITEQMLQASHQPTENNFHAEIAIAYEVFLQQWLPSREFKVSSDILQALSSMYPLLSQEKIAEQATKIIPQLLNFYRRSMDRNAITTLLASVLKTSIENDPKSLDSLSDVIISSLFDLVCVNPDYVKPQTVKGHYEVLRCYDLLAEICSDKIFDLLFIQLRSNNERERIKALLVMTHLINTFDFLVSPKISEFMPLFKQMMQTEKSFKVKMALLKTIVGLTQKDVATDMEFIRFMLKNSLKLVKVNQECGTLDEHMDFVEACKSSLYILASTVRTIDIIMKQVLLEHFMILEYTGACTNIAKCLANLFIKSTDPIFMVMDDPTENDEQPKVSVPTPESVFIRCLVLLGNTKEHKRCENILTFLLYFCPLLNKRLQSLWKDKIPELLALIGKDGYLEQLYDFLMLTVKTIPDGKFAETLVMKIADQIVLYPMITPISDYSIQKFATERGMLLKILGLCLCYTTDNQTIEAKIDLIINTARQEKIDKNNPESMAKLRDACEALGFASQTHSTYILKKLNSLVHDEGSRKSGGSFFSGLNFIKDSGKEAEIHRIIVLTIDSYGHIVQTAPQSQVLQDVDTKFIHFLNKQLSETKDFTIRKMILTTLLTITKQLLMATSFAPMGCKSNSKSMLLNQVLKIDFATENLPLLPDATKLVTNLINLQNHGGDEEIDVASIFEEFCKKFFTIAQQLKSKFESVEEDERNSYLAKYLNLTLPELNALVKVIFEGNSSPSTLDDLNTVLEFWIKDANSEVRICSSHVMNNALEVYMKTVKIGCEAPSKFNQTGAMLARIVPRCIDSNATVRQTAIEIVQRILEISCIYESLTIADSSVDWIRELHKIGEQIITDDPLEIYRIAADIARIIGYRLSSFQYLQFSKTLLFSLNDVEQSSAIGASVVLRFFLQYKGSELFHAIPNYIEDALKAIGSCPNARAKTGVLKALVALTKHHPKLVCTEMLAQSLPYEANVEEFWKLVAGDTELADVILDNFLTIISSSCLYESGDADPQVVSAHPFAIFCALQQMVSCKEIQSVLKQKLAEMFCTLLTSLAVYTNLVAPILTTKPTAHVKVQHSNSKSKFGFAPSKEIVKLNPCSIVSDTFHAFLDNLELEQISAVLSVCPNLATSTDLNNFMEILTPMAVSLVNQFGINSTNLRQIISILSKYVSSPYDPQRIAAVGLYSQLIPLKPTGEISSVIMLHLNSALSDPNPLVRGFCIRGFAYVGHLNEHDIHKYAEGCVSSLLKGIDDSNPNCYINIPLESIRGLSRVLTSLPSDKFNYFQVSLAIRIRPFYENPSADIREAAILLFGDLCDCKAIANNGTNGNSMNITEEIVESSISTNISDAFKEQLFSNLFSMLLHLSETNHMIVKACKATLRKLTALIAAPKLNTMIQSHLLDHGQLNYDFFVINLMKVISDELQDNIPGFIESCLPYLKSTWSEIRSNAAVIIGLLYNANRSNQQVTDGIGQKISALLKDDQMSVRIKAANALGYMFGNPL